jgi:hypothetical protein
VPLLFLLLIFIFSFFPQVGVCLSRGYAALAQDCLWEYRGTMKLTWSTSSQAVWARATGSPGTLLVSLFNVKWRFSVLAGGVEVSKFCVFSVIMQIVSAICICCTMLQIVSPASLQDFTIGGSLSASSL